MSPSELEQQAILAGASPAAAAAARAFCEALPDGTKMPGADPWRDWEDGYECVPMAWFNKANRFVFLQFEPGGEMFCCSDIAGPFEQFHQDWRPGQPVPPRVLELIARVAT